MTDQPGPILITKDVYPGSTDLKKACQECAEPSLVELDVAAKAELPNLANLFEDKIKKTLASLKLTLENESVSTSIQNQDNNTNNNNNNHNSNNGSGVPTGLFAGLNGNINTAGLFRKTCEDKVDAIEKKHIVALKERCERVIRTGFEIGACLQSKVDKVIKLLDVMISTELARDCSQFRSDIVQEFKTRYNMDQKFKGKANVDANAKVDVEKRGLLSDLLGDDNGLGETVHKVVAKTVILLTGSDLVEHLVERLTRTVKSVGDSFVGNCNHKGLLDFDKEKSVGALAAIVDAYLDLFKIVCPRPCGR